MNTQMQFRLGRQFIALAMTIALLLTGNACSQSATESPLQPSPQQTETIQPSEASDRALPKDIPVVTTPPEAAPTTSAQSEPESEAVEPLKENPSVDTETEAEITTDEETLDAATDDTVTEVSEPVATEPDIEAIYPSTELEAEASSASASVEPTPQASPEPTPEASPESPDIIVETEAIPEATQREEVLTGEVLEQAAVEPTAIEVMEKPEAVVEEADMADTDVTEANLAQSSPTLPAAIETEPEAVDEQATQVLEAELEQTTTAFES